MISLIKKEIEYRKWVKSLPKWERAELKTAKAMMLGYTLRLMWEELKDAFKTP